MNTVQTSFENAFSTKSLENYIILCNKDEISPLMLKLLDKNQPVLEAGCGNGKWMHYLKQHNITSTGIDWSEALQSLSREYDPTVHFDVGDLRQLPYGNESFGSIIALGSVEHVAEGPMRTLLELHRILKINGVGIITVPYYSSIRRASYILSLPLQLLRHSNIIRRLLKKPLLSKRLNIPDAYRKDVYKVLSTASGSLEFYEYQFTRSQFSEELSAAGFTITNIFGNSLDEGILHTFGRIVGKWDANVGEVKMNTLGYLIKSIVNPDNCGHMLCAIVKKS